MVERVAMLSVHTCPFESPGHRDTGGMNVYVREMSRCLGRMGVHVDIFTRSKDPAVPKQVKHGDHVQVVHLRAGPQRRVDRFQLESHLDEFIEGIRQFVSAEGRSYQILHGHYWLSGLVSMHLSREMQIPMVQNFHSIGLLKNMALRTNFGKEGFDPVQRLLCEKEIMEAADKVIAESSVTRDEIISHFRVDPGKVDTIPGGVDLDLFRPISKTRARSLLGWSGKIPILFVGRPDPVKGISALIEAVKIVCNGGLGGRRDLLWVFVGGEDEKIKKIVCSCRPPEAEFTFINALEQQMLALYYSASEVCVLPSYYESFGIVALEAAACGTPIVGSRVGGLPTIIDESANGFLIPPGDFRALAKRLLYILSDDIMRRDMAESAALKAREFEWGRMASRLHKVYDGLAGNHRGAIQERPALPRTRWFNRKQVATDCRGKEEWLS